MFQFVANGIAAPITAPTGDLKRKRNTEGKVSNRSRSRSRSRPSSLPLFFSPLAISPSNNLLTVEDHPKESSESSLGLLGSVTVVRKGAGRGEGQLSLLVPLLDGFYELWRKSSPQHKTSFGRPKHTSAQTKNSSRSNHKVFARFGLSDDGRVK